MRCSGHALRHLWPSLSTASHRRPARPMTSARQAMNSGVLYTGAMTFGGGLTVRVSAVRMSGRRVRKDRRLCVRWGGGYPTPDRGQSAPRANVVELPTIRWCAGCPGLGGTALRNSQGTRRFHAQQLRKCPSQAGNCCGDQNAPRLRLARFFEKAVGKSEGWCDGLGKLPNSTWARLQFFLFDPCAKARCGPCGRADRAGCARALGRFARQTNRHDRGRAR